ncbi:hypothetical protein GCM10020331_018910 [Ectobacillus funiculus]
MLQQVQPLRIMYLQKALSIARARQVNKQDYVEKNVTEEKN